MGSRIVVRLASAAIGCLIMAGAAQAGGGDASRPDPRTTTLLGGKALSIIAGATRIEPYRLKAAMTAPKAEGPDSVAGYFWTARGADLWPTQADGLKRILLDPASFDFSSVKKCPFVPDVAFRFVAREGSAVVLASLQCGILGVASAKAEPATANFDPAAARLRAIVNTVFKLD